MTAERFDEYARRLESFGFMVLQNARAAYKREAVFTDGKDIGIMREGCQIYGEGVQFFTVCYPHKTVKTGYQLQFDSTSVPLAELTEAKAREAFALTPPWVKEVPEGLHKYDDFEHWKRHSFIAPRFNTPTPTKAA